MQNFLKRFSVIFFLSIFCFQLDLSADTLAQRLKPALQGAASDRLENLRGIKTVLRSLFSCIPYYPQIKINSDEALQLTLYSIFKASGLCVDLGKSGSDPILIVKYNGTNYLISCEFKDVRSIHLTKKIFLKPHPKRKKKKTKSLHSAQIDSRLKIYIDDSLNNNVLINSDRSFSCYTDCIYPVLDCLNNGSFFRSNINNMANVLRVPLNDFFKKIPYEISCEKGFHLVLYAMFKMNGFDVDIESSSVGGRSDLIVKAGSNIYVFELKYFDGNFDINKAITQIILKRYSEQYFGEYKRQNIFGIAISFGPNGLQNLTVARLPEPVTPAVMERRSYPHPGGGTKRRRLSFDGDSE